MTIHRTLPFSILMSAISMAGPALAQNWTRQGLDVACDDGRRGVLSGDAIIPARHPVEPHLAASERHHAARANRNFCASHIPE
jgi:hypothetical protein